MSWRNNLRAWRGLAGLLFLPTVLQAQFYRHDAEGRLIEARYDATHHIVYRYDTVGNLTNLAVTGMQAETDSDGDGMADAWEWVWFDSLAQTGAGDFNQDTVSNLDHYLARSDPVTRDSDGDGALNPDEIAAGTDPLDADSVFKMKAIRMRGSIPVVEWSSVTNKHYRIQQSTNLLADFATVQTNVAATPPLNVHTDHTAVGVQPRVYRIQLE